MKNRIMKFLQQSFCLHEYVPVRNIYGDEINLLNARSEWKCIHCDKPYYSPELL